MVAMIKGQEILVKFMVQLQSVKFKNSWIARNKLINDSTQNNTIKFN